MKNKQLLVLVVLIALLASALSGCTRPTASRTPDKPDRLPSSETTDSESGTGTSIEKPEVKVYFVRGEKIGVGVRDVTAEQNAESLALAAMTSLVAGPTAEEKEFGLGTVIPDGTRVNGVKIDSGVATVDLSEEFASGGGSLSMQMRAAQVVCTLTQFSRVKSVAFKLDGKKIEALGGEGVKVGPTVSRADFEDMLPSVLVETPAPGQTVTSPMEISGSSNVFEATHQMEITDPDGLIIAEKTVTATSGTGTRGTWSVDVSFGPPKFSGLGSVIVFENSAKDGKRINIVEIPVRMEK